MSMVRSSFVARGILAIAVGALLAPLVATPASAQEDDPVIDPFSVPIVPSDSQSSPTIIRVDGTGSVVIEYGDEEELPRSGCYTSDIGTGIGTTACIGQASLVDPTQTPLTVGTTAAFLASH